MENTTIADVIIIGAGIFGLWCAKRCSEQGMRVLLLEEGTIGKGASHGFLGALMSHMPTGWNGKKQFQFEALQELALEVERLEEEIGLKTGYRQCGRVIPIKTDNQLRVSYERARAANDIWQRKDTGFSFSVCGYEDRRFDGWRFDGWLEPSEAPFGFVFDTLAATIDPRAYIRALRVSLEASKRVEIRENSRCQIVDANRGVVAMEDGTELSAGHLILTAGYKSFNMLQPFVGGSLGGGVKGQAALLKMPVCADWPILYDDGIYVISRGEGLCAVGSTSEKDWQNRDKTDEKLDDVLQKARRLCPALEGASVVERWAGVRPKCWRRDPIVGRLPEFQRLIVACGGFKISFGIAHKIADAVVQTLLNDDITLPTSFQPDYHLSALQAKLKTDNE